MAKRTPDRKVAQGGIVGVVVGAVTLWVTSKFHLSGDAQSAVVSAFAVAGHFAGSYLAPYQPRIEEIVHYVKELLAQDPLA